MRSRSVLGILLILLAAAAAWWANTPPANQQSTTYAKRVAPYTLVKARIASANGRVSGQTGRLLYRYQAKVVEHSGQDGEVRFTDLTLNYFPAKQAKDPTSTSAGRRTEWVLAAPQGTLSPDRQSLLLEAPAGQSVVMKRVDINPPQVVQTAQMILHPHQYTALGERPITITAGTANVRADAFELDFTEDVLLLRHNVRGHYEP